MAFERKPTISGEVITDITMAKKCVDRFAFRMIGLIIAAVLAVYSLIYAFYIVGNLMTPNVWILGGIILGLVLITRWQWFIEMFEDAWDKFTGFLYVLLLGSCIVTVYVLIPVIGVSISIMRTISDYRNAKRYINKIHAVPVSERFDFGSVKNQRRAILLSSIATIIIVSALIVGPVGMGMENALLDKLVYVAYAAEIIAYILIGLSNVYDGLAKGVDLLTDYLPIIFINIVIFTFSIVIFYLLPVSLIIFTIKIHEYEED